MGQDCALLNGPQRAHLSVLAAGIEDTLAEIERLLDPALDHGCVLTHHVADLPDGFAERVRPLLDELRTRVASFTERFSLEGRSFSRASSIQAHVSAQIVRLDESGVRQLRGYGKVTQDLDAVLAPALDEFRTSFVAIRALLRHGSGLEGTGEASG